MFGKIIGVFVALVTGNGFVDKRRFFFASFSSYQLVWTTRVSNILNLNLNLFNYVLKTVKTVAKCQEGSGGGEIEVSGVRLSFHR